MSQPEQGTRTCTKCGEAKALSEFYHNASGGRPRGDCKACVVAHGLERRDPEQRNATYRKWYAENREEARQRYIRGVARDPIKHKTRLRRAYLRRTYDMTLEAYDALRAEQGYRCAICGKDEEEQRQNMSVDHDHSCCPGATSCGRCVRGLLCDSCNRRLGWFDINCEAILAYIEGNTRGGQGLTA